MVLFSFFSQIDNPRPFSQLALSFFLERWNHFFSPLRVSAYSSSSNRSKENERRKSLKVKKPDYRKNGLPISYISILLSLVCVCIFCPFLHTQLYILLTVPGNGVAWCHSAQKRPDKVMARSPHRHEEQVVEMRTIRRRIFFVSSIPLNFPHFRTTLSCRCRTAVAADECDTACGRMSPFGGATGEKTG